MLFHSFGPFLLTLLSVKSALSWTAADTSQTDRLAAQALSNLKVYEAAAQANGTSSNCTTANAIVRRDWTDLSNDERVAYSDAVLCLMTKPSISNRTEIPGARSRYDDFVAAHIQQTLTIHGTTNFLSWHRYFVYTYEDALRNECGYTGYQPYWNWGKSAQDPFNSPYFDGSAYSMGGNGVYEFHNCTNVFGEDLNCIPAGVGGGCVITGPFRNATANLGPLDATLAEPEVKDTATGLSYNPRCMKRDINDFVTKGWGTDDNSTSLITGNTDVYWFQTVMQGNSTTGDFGVHGAGHFTYTGDPAGDIYSSPGDPMFFLHHAQIDRTWWIWQMQDIATRQYAVSGTITFENNPPSRNGTLDDNINLGYNAGNITIREAMSTLAGAFCYTYE